jgi:hypothetical protein
MFAVPQKVIQPREGVMLVFQPEESDPADLGDLTCCLTQNKKYPRVSHSMEKKDALS